MQKHLRAIYVISIVARRWSGRKALPFFHRSVPRDFPLHRWVTWITQVFSERSRGGRGRRHRRSSAVLTHTSVSFKATQTWGRFPAMFSRRRLKCSLKELCSNCSRRDTSSLLPGESDPHLLPLGPSVAQVHFLWRLGHTRNRLIQRINNQYIKIKHSSRCR